MTKVLLMFFLFSTTGLVYAQSVNLLKDTSDSVTVALDQFKADSNTDTINLFKGIKANPVNGGVAVKIYLEDGANIPYACHKHQPSDPFECHRSN